MSHDIRTPITGMLGLIQSLLNTVNEIKTSSMPASEVKNVLDNIINAVRHDGELLIASTDELLQLCNEVLEAACLELGKASALTKTIPFVLSKIDPLYAHAWCRH